MLITLSSRGAICYSAAEMQLNGMITLGVGNIFIYVFYLMLVKLTL